MTVAELIRMLQKCNPDALVVFVDDKDSNYVEEVAEVRYINGDKEVDTIIVELR